MIIPFLRFVIILYALEFFLGAYKIHRNGNDSPTSLLLELFGIIFIGLAVIS